MYEVTLKNGGWEGHTLDPPPSYDHIAQEDKFLSSILRTHFCLISLCLNVPSLDTVVLS